MELIKWSVVDMRYMIFFVCYKEKVFFCACPCLYVYKYLATLTLYRRAHECQNVLRLRFLSLIFSCISHPDETDAPSNTSLTTSCSVRFCAHCSCHSRIVVNDVCTVRSKR